MNHNKAVNMAFLDGHVTTVPLRQLWTLPWCNGWITPKVMPVIH